MRTQSLKKPLAALAAAAISMGVGVIPALADGGTPETVSTSNLTGSLTISGDKMSSRSFDVYRIFDYDNLVVTTGDSDEANNTLKVDYGFRESKVGTASSSSKDLSDAQKTAYETAAKAAAWAVYDGDATGNIRGAGGVTLSKSGAASGSDLNLADVQAILGKATGDDPAKTNYKTSTGTDFSTLGGKSADTFATTLYTSLGLKDGSSATVKPDYTNGTVATDSGSESFTCTSPTQPSSSDPDQCQIAGLTMGYYLVVERAQKSSPAASNLDTASYLMLLSVPKTGSVGAGTVTRDAAVTAASAVTAVAKSVSPTSDKYISNGTAPTGGTNSSTGTNGTPTLDSTGTPSAGEDADSTQNPTFQVGQDLWYTVKFTIPANTVQDFIDNKTTFKFWMQDYLYHGLTPDLTSAQLRVSSICTTDSAPATKVDCTTSGAKPMVFTDFASSTDSAPNTKAVGGQIEDDETTTDKNEKTDAIEAALGLNLTTLQSDTKEYDSTTKKYAGTYLQWRFDIQPKTATRQAANSNNDVAEYLRAENYAGQDVSVYISYKAKMNENAVIESTGNENDFNVKYTRNALPGYGDNDVSSTPKKSPKVYTSQLTLTKIGSDTNAALSGATFCVTDNTVNSKPTSCTAGDHILNFKKTAGTNTDDPDTYLLVDSSRTAGAGETITPTLASPTSGKIQIQGLNDETAYKVWEMTAPGGYTVLSGAITLTVSVDTTKAFAPDDDNETNTVAAYYPTSGTGGSATHVIGNAIGYTATITGNGTTSDSLTITNRRTGTLPITGGQGIALAVIVGLGLVGVGAVVTKRSRKADAEA